MEKEDSNLAFYELRGNIVSPEKIQFKKKLFGGCDAKEVYEHVQFMSDRLYHAELNFNNQLEEFKTMAAMLTQEKNDLGEKLLQAEAYQKSLERQLKEREAELHAISERYQLLHKKLNGFVDIQEKYDDLNKLAEEQQQQISDCNATNATLSEDIARLQFLMKDTSEKLAKAKGGVSPEKYQKVVVECEQLQDQYQAVLAEKDIIVAEKNEVLEQSKTTADSLQKMNEQNRKLWQKNVKQSLEMRKFVSMFETKAHEVAHNQMQNIDKIRSSIQDILDILDHEGTNMLQLIQHPYEELEKDETHDIGHSTNFPKLFELRHEHHEIQENGEG